MSPSYHVAAFAPADPEDRKGRATKVYEQTVMAGAAAVADFHALVGSGKYEYVVIEWLSGTDDGGAS